MIQSAVSTPDFRDHKILVRSEAHGGQRDNPVFEVLRSRVWFPTDPERAVCFRLQWTDGQKFTDEAQAYYHYLQSDLPVLPDELWPTVTFQTDQSPLFCTVLL